MDDCRELLKHMLGSIAYRVQKALRGAPFEFGEFRATPDTRNPRELVRHINSVLGYARTFFIGGTYRPEPLESLEEEVRRLHRTLHDLRKSLSDGPFEPISAKQLLQGPLSDAMTHAGQLAMLRRMAGSPVPPENFVFADVSADNVTADQPDPIAPDEVWEAPGT